MSASFHFVSLRFAKPKRFLTMVDPVGKPRIVTFKDRSTADNAVRYMARFMAKHGEWPIMDLSPDSNLNKVTKKEKPIQIPRLSCSKSWNTSRMTLNAWP